MNEKLIKLKWSLQALAQPAIVQIWLYPDFVCKADELALYFDDVPKPLRSGSEIVLTPDQLNALVWNWGHPFVIIYLPKKKVIQMIENLLFYK